MLFMLGVDDLPILDFEGDLVISKRLRLLRCLVRDKLDDVDFSRGGDAAESWTPLVYMWLVVIDFFSLLDDSNATGMDKGLRRNFELEVDLVLASFFLLLLSEEPGATNSFGATMWLEGLVPLLPV